jgi:hypothetical protein
MKSLVTLLRIQQREMDALKRQQGVLEAQREEVNNIIRGLDNQLVSERKAAEAMPDMAHFFGDYSASIKKQQLMMFTHLRQVDHELEKLSVQLRERFSDLKKYELALANWNKRRDAKLAAAAQQEMDEIGIRGYVRKDAY